MASAPDVEALWKRTIDDWENEKVHGALLEYCDRTNQLVEAAVRYRGMSADRDRSERAEKQLKAISVLALARLEATRTSRKQANRHATRIVAFVLLLAALAATLIRMGSLLE